VHIHIDLYLHLSSQHVASVLYIASNHSTALD